MVLAERTKVNSIKLFLVFALCNSFAAIAQASGPPSQPGIPSYLITNDDLPPKVPTSGTFFTVAANGMLQNPTRVSLGGVGVGGGYFTANRVNVLNSSIAPCAYLSVGGSAEVGAIDISTLQLVGNFPASSTDLSFDSGLGLANNGSYLYANYSTSNTIATFAILPGCSLQFLSDISVLGLQGGTVNGMAVHGNIMVVAYGDGSIESFNLSDGAPVSDGDRQNATGYFSDRFPTGVDITQDGHYAIFGDMATGITVEVSDISSGKLTKTLLYNLGHAGDSNNVLLSPDETLLYVANNSTGQVTAAFFDKNTGRVSRGCTSAPLKNFYVDWVFLSSPVTELASGTGSVLYLAEFGSNSGIGVVKVASSAGKCTLTEAANSPVVDPNSTSLVSIGFYPARSF